MIPRWLLTLLQPPPEMRTVTLTRWAHTDDGVVGRLGQFYTLENRWRGNEPRVSCIPAGTYEMVPGFFNRGGYAVWEELDVPGRSHILFHVGNTEKDTLGCPLVGRKVGVLGGKIAVLDSRTAFAEWMAEMGDRERARLVIEDVTGVSG